MDWQKLAALGVVLFVCAFTIGGCYTTIPTALGALVVNRITGQATYCTATGCAALSEK